MRWPKGPPHLALNPPYLFVLFFFGFLCLFFICFLIGKPCFSPKKGNFCLFICVSLCFSFALFGPPPFFSLSLSLSLSLSCYFLSSILPVFFISLSGSLFLFLFGLLLGSRCYVVFLFLLVVFFCFESSCLIYFCFVSCFLLLVVLGFCCFPILYFFEFWLPIKNISENIGNCKKKNKNEKCTKKDILTRAVSTGVLTNSVIFSFLCFFKFCIFC